MSIHIGATKGDIAETVLLAGDPLRAKFVADNYLEDVSCYNTVRNMLGFSGTYKGKRISVQGSGMGIPSFSIYAHELFRDYGVKKAVRIGSCGSLQEDVRLRDIIIAQGACTSSSVNRYRFNQMDYAPIADFELLVSAVNMAKELGIAVKVGNIFSSDEFYDDNTEWWKPFAAYGVLAVEMETTALYTIAAKYGAQALTLLTVSDSLVTGEATSSQDRQSTFTEMMEIALGAV